MPDYTQLPESLREGTRLYIQAGIPPGRFMGAVVANDLMLAVLFADPDSGLES